MARLDLPDKPRDEDATDLAVRDEAVLVNIETGELVPATPENAVVVLEAARNVKRKIDAVINDATDWLVSEAQRQGTKTLHTGRGDIVLTGGTTVDYDPADLTEALRKAGCPEERLAEAVTETISYKVNRSVLRQLAGANPDYKAAIGSAERTVEKRWQAKVKT